MENLDHKDFVQAHSAPIRETEDLEHCCQCGQKLNVEYEKKQTEATWAIYICSNASCPMQGREQ